MRRPGLISTRFPYLPLTLRLGAQAITVDALLDTGFDGDVVLPAAMIAETTPPDFSIRWLLADGSPIQAPAYLATARVGDFGPFDVVVTVLGGEAERTGRRSRCQ